MSLSTSYIYNTRQKDKRRNKVGHIVKEIKKRWIVNGEILGGEQRVISCILCDSLCLLVGNYSLVADDTLCSHTQTRICKHPHAPSGQICSVFMMSAMRDSIRLL